MAPQGAGLGVGLLALGSCAELRHPTGRHAVLYAPRQRQAFAHRRAAVARRAQLTHQLEVHLGVGKARHAGAAALHLVAGPGLRPHRQRQAGGGSGHEVTTARQVQRQILHGVLPTRRLLAVLGRPPRHAIAML